MSRIPTALVVACLFSLTAFAQEVFYFPQIGDGQTGPIRFQTSIILVNTNGATNVTIEFFDSQGRPLILGLGQLGSASRFQIPLGRGDSVSLQTPGTGAIKVGYARITVASGGDVGGTAVFTRTDIPTGTILYEAGVPPARNLQKFSIFVDTIGDRDTGLAMVNVDSFPTRNHLVSLDLYDTQFNQIATTDVPLSGGRHLPRFIPQIFNAVPQAAEMEGSVVVTSSDDLAAVTLRTKDSPFLEFPDEVPTLTAFPVVEGGASLSSAGIFSILSSGKIAIVMDVGDPTPRVIGAIFHLFEGDEPGRQFVRAIEDPGIVSLVLPAESADGSALTVDRVDVELILEGGTRSPRIQLAH